MKRLIANNKKAYYDYFIEDKYECGIELVGTEVKSLFNGTCSIKESMVRIINNQCYIYGMNIPKYENGNIFNHDTVRERKLLLHKKEIVKISEKIKEKGYTLVPLQVYFADNNRIKVEIGVAKGKKLYDKRESIKKKDIERNIKKEVY